MIDFFEIQNLSCGYSKFSLQDISFNIEQGMLAGIIGPNGSGKSTLFKGITGELKLQSGKQFLSGQNLSDMSISIKAQNIAIVTQNTEKVDISVEDYVLMGRLPYRKKFYFFESQNDYEIAEKYMKLTDVYHYRNKLMSELSGGEQQLAAIARALTQEPKLLLLDEPTSHLDITHQIQTLNLIQQLNHDLKLTVLMIIHDLNLAGEYCDYLIMMNNGRIHTSGKPKDVLTYNHIEDIYKTAVITQTNPVSNKPAVFLVSGKVLEEMNSKLNR